jgi:hypothetical protein
MSSLAGQLLKVTAVGHTLVGLVLFRAPLADIVGSGVLGSVGTQPDRQAAFWFLLFSPVCYALGQIVERGDRRILAIVGWNLLLLGVVGAAMMPVSGFWILLALAPLVLRGAGRRNEAVAAA